MARPKSSSRRDCQLNFSLTADELATLRARAAAVDQPLVEYGRAQLMRRPMLAEAPAAIVNGLRADRLVVIQLRRLGNLLNQLVRRCHARDEALPPDLQPLLADLRALIDRMLPHGS